MMTPRPERPTTMAAWIDRAGAAISTLKTLSPDDFFDGSKRRYHPVCGEIAILAWGLETDADSFARFLDDFPQRRGWLPDERADLLSMTDEEIVFRLRKNVADGRWVDDALSGPFSSGTLVAALERLVAAGDGLRIRSG